MYDEILNNRYIGAAAIISINENSKDRFSFVNVNDRYINELELNVSVSDFLQKDYFEFITDAEKDDFCKIAMVAAQKGETTECDYRCRSISDCTSSEEMHLTSRIVFIEKIEDDYYFFEEIYNNNKHTSNLETLAESDRKFRIAYDQINIYSWEYTVADHSMRPCFRCMRDLGLPPVLENYPESAIERGIIPENYAGMFRQWHKALDMGEKELETIIPLTSDRIPFRVRYTAEYDKEGKPYKAYGSATLVTDDELRARAASAERLAAQTEEIEKQRDILKEREEELKKALESAREANQAKTQFLSNMSHDIRTPMNAVVGFTSLAKLNIDNKEKTFEYLGKIENASNLLLRILNDILDITRIESGEITLTEDEIDIRKEVEAIDEIFSKLAEEHGVELTHDVSKVRDFRIYGDRLRLNQILMNIISNAIKYTEKGGYVCYSITQSDSDREGCNRYTITVRDNGIGMSKEFLAHAFEIFTREKNSTMSKVMGTGLGMAIIKRLVDVMDGNIEIESEQGVGTTVVVDLDLKRRDTLDDNTSGDALENEADDTILEGKRILVVDDQSVNRVIVKEMLNRYGVIVDEAEDGNDAIRKIESADDRYDIILMDVQMPVMNGYEATKRIREMEDLSKASSPILAMTADAFADDKVKAQESGMNEHIAKPINIRNTVKLIKKYLS